MSTCRTISKIFDFVVLHRTDDDSRNNIRAANIKQGSLTDNLFRLVKTRWEINNDEVEFKKEMMNEIIYHIHIIDQEVQRIRLKTFGK